MKIIGIEGIDGSGKSLQFNLLMERFASEKIKSLGLSFPVYEDFFGREIGRMLSGKDAVQADRVDAKSMALWYAADRFAALKKIGQDQYDCLLLNRYTLSNMVYQGIRYEGDKEEFSHWVFSLEHEHFALPQPDVYFLLDIDDGISADNVAKKGYRAYTGNSLDVYEKSPEILQNAREAYLSFARSYENIHIVNCMAASGMKAPEEIHEALWDSVKKMLNPLSRGE